MIKFLFNIRFAAMAVMLLAVASCSNDDEIPTPPSNDDVVASFQFAVSADNPLTVDFSNFSLNATSYSWDFGDGNTNSDKDPSHTYESGGTYTVTLTASGAGADASKSETVTVTDPNAVTTLLAGNGSKTWYLMREGVALGIGPNLNDNQYWSFGGVTPLGERPCILDDSFTFNLDGTFEFESNNTIWVDLEANGGWLGPNTEGCFEENTTNLTSLNGDDLSAFGNGGAYTYEYDAAAGSLKLLGEGAFIGLANKTGAGDSFIPLAEKEYKIFNFVEGSVADSLQMAIEINDGNFWNFYLVSYENPADLPAIPGSMPSAGFSYVKDGFTITCTNSSTASTSYMWEFGDGGMSSEENPTYTYSSEGEFTITLTASDDMGQSDDASQNVIISAATFDPAVLSNATGKVWKLDGEASYYVGPTAGSNEWWPGIDANGAVERACQLDDEFIFFDNGTMEYDAKGMVFAESYMGGSNACIAETDLVSPFDLYASGTHMFSATAEQITATGDGAFIGFNKGPNDYEMAADGSSTPASQIVYDVLEYTNVGNKETVTFTVGYNPGADGYWTMRLFSEN